MKINLLDSWSLLAVWETKDQGWELVGIDRLKRAIALCALDGLERLVFPTYVDPNQVWGKRPQVSSLAHEEIKAPSKRQLLLELIEFFPGQSTTSLAERMGTSTEAVTGYLRTLVRQGKVHCRQSPADGRSKLYYLGQEPSQVKSGVIINACRLTQPTVARREPPIRVYFVDPRSLLEVNK